MHAVLIVLLVPPLRYLLPYTHKALTEWRDWSDLSRALAWANIYGDLDCSAAVQTEGEVKSSDCSPQRIVVCR